MINNRWLLLLHQVPPSPPYLRAKVLRRLKQVGAMALKSSAYLLPNQEDTLEDFEWILKEIQSDGGAAWLLRTEAVGGLTDESIRDSFRALRSADYRDLVVEVQAAAGETEFRKLSKRFEEIRKIDFFDAPGKDEVLALMTARERKPGLSATHFAGRRWVTRRGIKIDRTACCWLIRRFIDPEATFRFADPDHHTHVEGDLRFDMFDGEFTHEGDRCTFEVLLEGCGLADPALRAIGEMVHDLDLKDGKFGRAETAGVATMIEGLALRHADDVRRMEDGQMFFDTLYAALKSR